MPKGTFSKWTKATINQEIWLTKTGVTFEVWTKWKRQGKKLGTLTVTVAGLRWLPHKGKREAQMPWDRVSALFEQ